MAVTTASEIIGNKLTEEDEKKREEAVKVLYKHIIDNVNNKVI
jgi:hypothetical protein